MSNKDRIEYLEARILVIEKAPEVIDIFGRANNVEIGKQLLRTELGFNDVQVSVALETTMETVANPPIDKWKSEIEQLKKIGE